MQRCGLDDMDINHVLGLMNGEISGDTEPPLQWSKKPISKPAMDAVFRQLAYERV